MSDLIVINEDGGVVLDGELPMTEMAVLVYLADHGEVLHMLCDLSSAVYFERQGHVRLPNIFVPDVSKNMLIQAKIKRKELEVKKLKEELV